MKLERDADAYYWMKDETKPLLKDPLGYLWSRVKDGCLCPTCRYRSGKLTGAWPRM